MCHRFSAFADTPLALLLRSNGIRSIVTAGVTTECAVETTIRDAASRDFTAVVAADAIATHDANRMQHDASVQVLANYFAITQASAEIISRWGECQPLRLCLSELGTPELTRRFIPMHLSDCMPY